MNYYLASMYSPIDIDVFYVLSESVFELLLCSIFLRQVVLLYTEQPQQGLA